MIRSAVVALAAPAFVLVPYLLDVRVVAALFLAAAVCAYPKSAVRPVEVGLRTAVHSGLALGGALAGPLSSHSPGS